VRDRGSPGRLRGVLVAAAIAAGIVLGVPAGATAATYPEAVLLVSGFDTASPYSSPDPSCNGKEGPEWSLPGGVGTTLKAAGMNVFTAPIQQAQEPLLPPCTGPGELLPPTTTVINSNGEVDANGKALASLIGFLRDEYGVQKLHLVGYSDGGLWSRSAITQDAGYQGVDILSLTTLGTPHTGSLVADLAIELNGGKCDFSNSIEQLICNAVISAVQVMVNDLGKVATQELTNGFLTPWNKQQRIGACPVTGIGGNAVGFNIPLLQYYTPNDGAVGTGSAHGEKTLAIDGSTIPAPGIPNFIEGGTYDVVHSPSLSFYSIANLLNTAAISNEVRTRIHNASSNTTPCNTSQSADPAPGPTEVSIPLYRLEAPNRRGRLERPDDGALVAAKPGVKVECGGTKLDSLIYRSADGVTFLDATGCDKKMRVKGKRRRALMLDVSRNTAAVSVDADGAAELSVDGPRVRGLRAVVRSGGHRVELSPAEPETLPDAELTWVRVRAKTKPGGELASGHALIPR
jgi:pimeloyl-ACP methyl ester carboxylesterase